MTALDIAQVRPVIESEIDRLIAILDMLEPDPDFEEGADLEEDNSDLEPLLGAPERQAGSWNGIESNFDDEGAINWDCEGLSGGFGNYGGPCSPITTMVAPPL